MLTLHIGQPLEMQRETVKIVIVGHVDHGKSTLIGRLLLDTNSLSKEKLSEIRKISKELGKETELAFLTDQLKEEREQDKTIDTTQTFFKTRRRNYVIIDAPGHAEFIKNMFTGASLAQAAVLIVDVHEGIREQTRRHAYVISMLGIDKVIVALNKMDLVNYEKERFDRVKTELLEFLKNLNISPAFIVPLSAKEGANILKEHSKMSWYGGPSLLKALGSLKLSTRNAKKPLRFPVQDTYEINGEKIVVGRISSGVAKQGQKIVIFPSREEARIDCIKTFGHLRKKAEAGESIGLILNEPICAKRGDVIAQKEYPPNLTDQLKGNIFWMGIKPLRTGEVITLRCATQEAQFVVEKIEKRINSSTLEIIEEEPKDLDFNDVGLVTLRTDNPIVTEEFSHIEELGRFTIEQEYDLQGAGIITGHRKL